MQPIGTMLRRTTHHVARQRELFALRTRKASSTFATETRNAGRELATAMRAEAGAWGDYVRKGTATIAPVAIERRFLVGVDQALRSLDARIRRRLDALDGHGKRPRAAKAKRQNGVRAVSRRAASASRPRAHAS
jgi:hypothetical protein